jgi:hypothetical protein
MILPQLEGILENFGSTFHTYVANLSLPESRPGGLANAKEKLLMAVGAVATFWAVSFCW